MDFDGALKARVSEVGWWGWGIVPLSVLFRGGPVTMHSVPGSYPLHCFDLLHNLSAISYTPY